ncbi:MAG: hypothetical protein U0232_33385, partial [Thermomicrobiales bacterium]
NAPDQSGSGIRILGCDVRLGQAFFEREGGGEWCYAKANVGGDGMRGGECAGDAVAGGVWAA